MSKIKALKFNISTTSYAEMGHLTLYKKDEPLVVDTNNKTLTLSNNEKIKITATASTTYNGWPAIAAFNAGTGAHGQLVCWCSSSYGSNWLKFEFEPAISKREINKLTFCCGQGHGTYPGTYELILIDENGKEESIGSMYVNKDNGYFELTEKVILVTRNNKWYYRKPKGETI